MNFERQKRLVQRLLDRTRAGDLPWQDGAGTDMFQVSFQNNSVQITKLDGYNQSSYVIAIIDKAGRTTDMFDDEQLIGGVEGVKIPWHSIMEELFISARRKALKADEAIDSILAEIG